VSSWPSQDACFYVSIDRLPLGTVAAIEFLPIIALAAVGMRIEGAVALISAVGGVYLLTDVRIEGEPVGVAFSFANAALFALYIILAHRVAQDSRMSGIDGLGAAMPITLAITPIGAWSAAPALFDPIAVAAGIGVGITSSVIPYVCDQLISQARPRHLLLMFSLLPATATVVGIVVLAQIPPRRGVAGVGLVVAAVAVARPRSLAKGRRTIMFGEPFQASACAIAHPRVRSRSSESRSTR
jgi:inner membrane transporter RhtA